MHVARCEEGWLAKHAGLAGWKARHPFWRRGPAGMGLPAATMPARRNARATWECGGVRFCAVCGVAGPCFVGFVGLSARFLFVFVGCATYVGDV